MPIPWTTQNNSQYRVQEDRIFIHILINRFVSPFTRYPQVCLEPQNHRPLPGNPIQIDCTDGQNALVNTSGLLPAFRALI